MVLCVCRKIQDGAWLCSDKNGHLCAVSTKPGPDRKRLLDQVQEDDTLFVKNVSASPIPGGMPGNSQIPMWTIILNRFEDVEVGL